MQIEEAKAAARADVYADEIERLKEWAEAYHEDICKETKAPFTSPDSAAMAMGRHVLRTLIKDYEAKAKGESRG